MFLPYRKFWKFSRKEFDRYFICDKVVCIVYYEYYMQISKMIKPLVTAAVLSGGATGLTGCGEERPVETHNSVQLERDRNNYFLQKFKEGIPEKKECTKWEKTDHFDKQQYVYTNPISPTNSYNLDERKELLIHSEEEWKQMLPSLVNPDSHPQGLFYSEAWKRQKICLLTHEELGFIITAAEQRDAYLKGVLADINTTTSPE